MHTLHNSDPARGRAARVAKEKNESDAAIKTAEKEAAEAIEAEKKAKIELAEYALEAFGAKLDQRKALKNLQAEVKKLQKKG